MRACDVVLFGAQGDLSRRKLIPSLYQLDKAGFIAPETAVVGVSRRDLADEAYVAQARQSLKTFMKEPIEAAVWERFARRLRHVQIDLGQEEQYGRLRERLDQAQRDTVAYCAVAPDLFGPVCSGLAAAGLATERARVVLEKPIGTDLASSRAVNDVVGAIFAERQVYRIDHYLVAGFNWSLGVALTHLTGKKAIEEAKVVGGVVRDTKDYSQAVALMFETHYLFKMRTDSRQQTTGNGPFVAIRLADTEGNTVRVRGRLDVGRPPLCAQDHQLQYRRRLFRGYQGETARQRCRRGRAAAGRRNRNSLSRNRRERVDVHVVEHIF